MPMTRFARHAALFALSLLVAGFSVTLARASDEPTDPQYFKVTNVASDDVLNVRAEPNGSAAIVGSLKPDAFPVEVFARQGDWGRIVFADANGWVSMNFLAPFAIAVVPGTKLPEGLVCGGTEPFWSAEVVGTDKLTFGTPDTAGLTFSITHSGPFVARSNADFIWAADPGGNRAAASIRRQMCSDGMSDRDYPMSIDLLLRNDSSADAFEGCCSLPVFEK